MELVAGLVVSLVANLLKKLVAKYGSLAVQALVLVVALLAAWAWNTWGATVDWTWWAATSGLAFAWYEILIKRVWPNK